MTRLVHAELLRLRSRRLTWVALGAVLLVVALTQVGVYTSVKPLSAEERAQAQVQYDQARREFDQNREQYELDAQECVAQGNPPDLCSSEPRLEDFAQRVVSPFSDMAGIVVTVTVFVSALALLLLSASLVGAEFSSGSLANWLTFVPGRSRVYGAKLVSLLLAGALATVVVTALGIAAAVVLGRLAGAEVTGVGAAVAMGGRGVLIAVIAVVLGFGLAVLTRHTIAAAGTVLGYLFLSAVLAVVMGALPGLQVLKRLLPENNALALLEKGHHYVDYVNVQAPDGTYSSTETEHVITMAHAGLYWAVVLAVVLTVSYLVFRRRDVL